MNSRSDHTNSNNQVPENGDVLSHKVHSYKKHKALLRICVSRISAGKGRALLECVGLDAAAIDTVYVNNSTNVEEAVQAGLLKWVRSDSDPTWKELIDAMKDAEIAVQDIDKLKKRLQKEGPTVVDKDREGGSKDNGPGKCLLYLLRVLCIAVLLLLFLLCSPNLKPMDVFRQRLQTKYNMADAPSSLKHLKVPNFKFFQLLIYEVKEITPGRDVVERLQHGEEPIMEYGRIMQAASGGKLVLLEGPPGSGKSTVSRQLCRDWATGVLGTEFELVVLVPLLELRKKEKMELEDLLRAAYGNLPDGVIQHIEAVDGKGLLIILDGYDELQLQTNGEPALIENLLRRSYLQHSAVIVTSRDIAAKILYDKQQLDIDKHFEIHGMRADEIPLFVSYYFGNSQGNATEVRSLLDTLYAEPRLTAACSNTLALAIVCYLHSQQQSIPTTMTGLYGQFLVITLREFVKTNPEHVELPEFMTNNSREQLLRDLPSLLQPGSPFSHLGALAELALEGVLQDKFVFEATNEILPQYPKGFDGYGLLDSAVISDDFGLDTNSYNLIFLHVTLQEFMAALFIANMTTEEQAAFWIKHLTIHYKGYSSVADTDRILAMFSFYCGLTGLENRWIRAHLLMEVDNLWAPSSQFDQTLVKMCHVAAESGDKEFVCDLLSPLRKKAKVDVDTLLDSADVAWCLNACKESFEELAIGACYSGNSVHAVADFLGQLNQLTSLSTLELPYMNCSTKVSELTCCQDLQTISRFWRAQTHPKTLKMKFTKSLIVLPSDLLPRIQEITLFGMVLAPDRVMSLLNELPALQTLVLEDIWLSNTSDTAFVEDPSVIDAISDAVKRHPNLISVTVGEGCSGSLTRGVVQGVLRKADVQKVDVIESWSTILNPYSKIASLMSPEFTLNDTVREYIIPAMKRGSLKTLAGRLKNSSNVESILRELPHTRMEELAIAMELFSYSEESYHSLVAATKAGLSESKALKTFRMQTQFNDAFLAKTIVTSVSRPLEELVLTGFHFHPSALKDYFSHLRNISLKKLCLWDVHDITPSDIATMLVGGLGKNGTLEELEIETRAIKIQIDGTCFQPWVKDVEDEVTLKAVEAAVRESTTVERITIDCQCVKWTNVTTALLKGATRNKSLRALILWTPKDSPPPQNVVDRLKQMRRRLMLRINVQERHSTKLGFRYSMRYGVNKVLSLPGGFVPMPHISTGPPHTNGAGDKKGYYESTLHRLVAASKAGLSKFKLLQTFRMQLGYKDGFLTVCILTNISRPPEKLVLRGFDFSDPGILVGCLCHLCKLSVKELIFWDAHRIISSDIASVLIRGLGKKGTLEVLEIEPWYLEKQACRVDVEDEETLKAIEAAVRESTSVKRIVVKCRHLNWTNVATALLKGATENMSLRELTLEMTRDSPLPQDVIAELKQKRRRLLLRVNVEECMHRHGDLSARPGIRSDSGTCLLMNGNVSFGIITHRICVNKLLTQCQWCVWITVCTIIITIITRYFYKASKPIL